MGDRPNGAIDVPGGWIVLRDPAEVTTRQRRPVQRAMRKLSPETTNRLGALNQRRELAEKDGDQESLSLIANEIQECYGGLPDAEVDALDEANDAASAALVAAWSFPGPVSYEAVLDLPAKAGDALRAVVAPYVGAMFVDTAPDPDPDSPFGGSNASSPSSQADPGTTSPTTPGATTAPSA
jgi:hypothetical protein